MKDTNDKAVKTDPAYNLRKGNVSWVAAVLFVILVSVFLSLAFLVIVKAKDLDIENMKFAEIVRGVFSPSNEKEQAPLAVNVPYEPEIDAMVGACGGNIVRYRDKKIESINKDGSVLWEITAVMKQPELKSSGNYTIVFDVNGNNVVVIKDENVKWTAETGGNIINAGINNSGYATVVQETRGYKTRVTVYDPVGAEIFSRNTSENFVLSASVSPQNNRVFLNCADTSGITVTTSIVITDLLGKEISAFKSSEDTFYPFCGFLEDNTLVAAGNNGIVFYWGAREGNVSNSPHEIKFEKVYSAGIVSGNFFAVALESGNGSLLKKSGTDLQLYNSRGEMIRSLQLDGEVISMSTFADSIALNMGREAIFINSDCEVLLEYAVMDEIEKIEFLSRKSALVIGKKRIVVLEI